MALLLLTSCTGGDDVTTDVESISVTEQVTDAGVENITSDAVFSAKEFTVNDGAFSSKFAAEGDFDGEISLSLTNGTDTFTDSKQVSLKTLFFVQEI